MFLVLLMVHVMLLAFSASRQSATFDEVGHVVAGLSHWRLGRFDLYRVNPPLVRLVACFPLHLLGAEADWSGYHSSPGRPEFTIGVRFWQNQNQNPIWLLWVGRWTCIPFSLLGAFICYRWSSELYGTAAALIAATLWCMSPNVLGHGQLVTPDIGAAALGAAAAYLFWKWLRLPSWTRALYAGAALGLAELSKSTWVILIVLWPLIWFVCCWRSLNAFRGQGTQLLTMIFLSILTLNVGYAFEGSFAQLQDYEFVSRTLSGHEILDEHPLVTGNRFANSLLGHVPVPLPKNYVLGIDTQKRDFEVQRWSYLRGEWRQEGWWYYYLYGLLVKEPLGTWGLAVLALCWKIQRSCHWRDELVLLAPAAAVLVLVSSQTGMNHHLRYVLPAYPFLIIGISRVAAPRQLGTARSPSSAGWRKTVLPAITTALLAWSITSSASVYPHSLSYFNELTGGPRHGHQHLLGSNIDWGQDLLYLKLWCAAHPDAQPLHLAYLLKPLVDPAVVGISWQPIAWIPSQHNSSSQLASEDGQGGREPGWYATSVCLLYSPDHELNYLHDFKPVAYAGYGIRIYFVTPQQAAENEIKPWLKPFPNHRRSVQTR